MQLNVPCDRSTTTPWMSSRRWCLSVYLFRTCRPNTPTYGFNNKTNARNVHFIRNRDILSMCLTSHRVLVHMSNHEPRNVLSYEVFC